MIFLAKMDLYQIAHQIWPTRANPSVQCALTSSRKAQLKNTRRRPAAAWTQGYTYDRFGNRSINQSGTTQGVGINSIESSVVTNTTTNRMYAPGETEASHPLIDYDAVGNQKKDHYSTAGVSFDRTYDAEDRMTGSTAVDSLGTHNTSYAYDADGRRVKRTVSGVETWQVYGLGGELLAEYPVNGPAASPQKEYGYCNGQLLITADAPTSTNYALATNGATASASSILSSSFPASATINGDRKGTSWGSGGGWADATSNTFPDSLEIDFSGTKTINEIDVFTLQDSYVSPSEPTSTMTFSSYGLSEYTLQYWDGSAWQSVPGGHPIANNKVWTRISFAAITTSKIKVVTNDAVDHGYSRVTEVEAWGSSTPPSAVNVALSTNGATASASSILSSSFPASGANNGDRKGTGWGSGGGWADSTSNSFPDWLQIDFSGTKTINEIDVFTLQDSYASPAEPTETMTFSSYGLSSYEVQYWDGSAWVTVTGGGITSNNKVWKKISFTALSTTKIRVWTHGSVDSGYSRITEVEAWSNTEASGTTSASINWLVTDQLGTPRMIFDKTGSLANTKRHDYLPFGEELYAGQGGRAATQGYGANDGVRQKFTQKERDNETGLDWFDSRYFSSSQGRFTSPDSYGGRLVNPQTLNLYSYVKNNPLKYVDPTGHDSENPQRKKGKKGADGDEGRYDPECDCQVVTMPAEACNCGTPSPSQPTQQPSTFQRVVAVSDTVRHYEMRFLFGYWKWSFAPVSSAIRTIGGEQAHHKYEDVVMGTMMMPLGAELKVEEEIEDLDIAVERRTEALVKTFDGARVEAFEKAGMTEADSVKFTKVDPETGTVVEFKGEGGAKVGYDTPHPEPGPAHDVQHIGWQSAGKRSSGGAGRGNIPYSGSRHPSRGPKGVGVVDPH
jgi:RHS repeat-associated protein